MKSNPIIDRIKSHPGVSESDKVGVVSSFGKGADVIVKADTRDIVVTANTGDIDLDHEVVVPSGADTSYFLKNRHVFADHKYDIADGAGRLRSLSPYPSKEDHRAWKMRVRINDNPIGNAIMDIVRETGQIGVSVGFVAKDYGNPTDDERAKYGGDNPDRLTAVIRKWDWFETSFTLLPCNVACQSDAFTEGKSLDMLDAVDRMVTKGVIKRDVAAALGMPITTKRTIIAMPKKKRLIFPDGRSMTMPA